MKLVRERERILPAREKTNKKREKEKKKIERERERGKKNQQLSNETKIRAKKKDNHLLLESFHY